jgi:hypothetical protein
MQGWVERTFFNTQHIGGRRLNCGHERVTMQSGPSR